MCKGKKHGCETNCKSKEKHCCQTTCRAEKMFGKVAKDKFDALRRYINYALTEIKSTEKKSVICADEAIHVLKNHAEVKTEIGEYLKNLQEKLRSGVKNIISEPNYAAAA